jgi:hypothetical protein
MRIMNVKDKAQQQEKMDKRAAALRANLIKRKAQKNNKDDAQKHLEDEASETQQNS